MKKYLFLDDVRNPIDCYKFFRGDVSKIYLKSLEEWEIVRTYDEFIKYIQLNGVPDFISFDHDLADEHYSPEMHEGSENYNKLYGNFKEKTGYDCAKWLIEYCSLNGIPLPDYIIHSMNPVGRENIKYLFDSYKKYEEKLS